MKGGSKELGIESSWLSVCLLGEGLCPRAQVATGFFHGEEVWNRGFPRILFGELVTRLIFVFVFE